MPAPHIEYFENVTIGQPVTSENTEFQTFVGVVQTAGTGVPGLQGNACQIKFSDPVQGAGYYDQALYVTENDGDRLVLSTYIHHDESITDDPLYFAWVSEATTNIVPSVAMLALSDTSRIISPGLTVASGDPWVPPGSWARIEMYLTHVPDTEDVEARVYVWTQVDLHSKDTSRAAGVLSGTLVGAYPKLAFECWVILGRHGGFPAPTSGAVTVDNFGVDANPWPPLVQFPEPGFFAVTEYVESPMLRTELLGEWNGTGYDELEFLGVWDGQAVVGQVPLIDTFWSEMWPANGPVGAPWTVTGTPSVTDGIVSGPAGWTIERAGLPGNGRYAVIVPSRNTMEVRMWWNNTGTGSGLVFNDSGGSYALMMQRQSGALRVLGSNVKPQGPAVFSFRRVAERIDFYFDDVIVISSWLTSAELAELGSQFRVKGDNVALLLGSLRSEVIA